MLLTKADYACNHNQPHKNRKDKILFILSSAQQHRLYGKGRDDVRERELASAKLSCRAMCVFVLLYRLRDVTARYRKGWTFSKSNIERFACLTMQIEERMTTLDDIKLTK